MGHLKEQWISELASPEQTVRAHGGAEIYNVGRSLADQAIRLWWQREEFRQLLGNPPEVTVGVAVRPDTFAAIREANGWPKLAEVPAEQDASEFTLHLADRITLDVLTSREPEGSGAIAKFLLKRGEGVQQVEFRCSDVDRATAILKQHFGILPVYREARPGADGTRVNFFLVPAPDGKKVLIELYEAAAIRFE